MVLNTASSPPHFPSPQQSIGEFVLTDPDMKIPKRGKIFAINEGYAQYWDESVTEYVRQCKYPPVSRIDLEEYLLTSIIEYLVKLLKFLMVLLRVYTVAM